MYELIDSGILFIKSVVYFPCDRSTTICQLISYHDSSIFRLVCSIACICVYTLMFVAFVRDTTCHVCLYECVKYTITLVSVDVSFLTFWANIQWKIRLYALQMQWPKTSRMPSHFYSICLYSPHGVEDFKSKLHAAHRIPNQLTRCESQRISCASFFSTLFLLVEYIIYTNEIQRKKKHFFFKNKQKDRRLKSAPLSKWSHFEILSNFFS